MPIVQGLKVFKFQQCAFTVDFGMGPVSVQKCGEICASSEGRGRITVARGLSHCRLFADAFEVSAKGGDAGKTFSIQQMNRKRDVLVSFALHGARVVSHSVGPWDNESSDFTMERIVIEYAGFSRTDTPAPVCAPSQVPTAGGPPSKITELSDRRFRETDPWHEADTITVSVTRGGVAHVLSTCTLDTPEELEARGLLAPWIEPDAGGFGALTAHEREQVKRLCNATMGYANDGVGQVAHMTDDPPAHEVAQQIAKDTSDSPAT